jgi:4-amino-4-deoxy-L-arabinose transferase-like glycosyltransferase
MAVALAALVALGPFFARPFNMDDPLFVWTARQIQSHPLDPYGFDVNWYGTASPMWSVTENPPLASYFLAGAGAIVGWSEVALHLAFFLPALAVLLGTLRLGRRFCADPIFATAAVLFTPVFLVCSGTLMCDVLMLALWVWAVVFWVEGIESNRHGKLVTAAVFAALCPLAKYFGICLVPLLGFYGLMARRSFGRWAVYLVLPLLTLGFYEWATHAVYQHALVSQAADYATKLHGSTTGAKSVAILTALTFTGGCCAIVLFLTPWLWGKRSLLLIGAAVGFCAVIFLTGTLWQRYGWLRGTSRLSTEAQIILWSIGGISVLALAIFDVWKRRDADAWLLAMWVLGTFVFTAFINWTINGRSILPMAPAVGILAARRLEARGKNLQNGNQLVWGGSTIACVVAAIFAFMVAQSDFVLATAARQSAVQISQRYTRQGRDLWFQGHWGFQYYMGELGGISQDRKQSKIQPGEFLVVPLDNCNLSPPDAPGDELHFVGPRFLTTMNINIGAGFYTAQGGPLPFAFGHVPSEDVIVYKWRPN